MPQSVERLVTGWTAKGRSSGSGRVKNFLFSMSSRPALEPTQPRIHWVPEVKRPELEADHSTSI
jgi:hypothetical protein